MKQKDFPGDPAVKTPHFHFGGTGSIPGWAELRSRMQCGVAKKKTKERISLAAPKRTKSEESRM